MWVYKFRLSKVILHLARLSLNAMLDKDKLDKFD